MTKEDLPRKKAGYQNSIEVKDCVFSFKCPKQWAALQVTENPNVRYCDSCKENVWFCKNGKALKEAVKLGRCVAVEISPYSDNINKLSGPVMLGTMEVN
jgi:hypothetical protein